jgi:hypothetical protein
MIHSREIALLVGGLRPGNPMAAMRRLEACSGAAHTEASMRTFFPDSIETFAAWVERFVPAA